MVRHYKRLHYWDRFNFKHIAAVILATGFLLYIGYVIMTPKTEVLQTLTPLHEGGKVVRLSKTYYQIAPLLCIEVKTKHRWQTIFIEPSSNKDIRTTWSEKNPQIQWDSSGQHLILTLNGSNVWHTAIQ